MGIGIENLSHNLEMKVYNNIFYDSSGGVIFIGSNTGNIITLQFKNNIFYAVNAFPLQDEDGDITAHTNNIYYRVDGGNPVNSNGISYSSANLTSYEGTALSSDPSFQNTADFPTGFIGIYNVDRRPNTEGLNTTEDSLARDNGSSLATLYNGSINSTMRLIASWDIGAYEGGSVLPSVPTKLRLVE